MGPQGGELVEIGLTDVAQNLAKGIISVTPKKVGRTLRVEQASPPWRAASGSVRFRARWPVFCGGERRGDRPAGADQLRLPYGAGWIARIEPAEWDPDSVGLVIGAEGIAAYERFLEREGISCEE